MRRRQATPERLLVTVLFTDIVGSTQLAAELGDRGWRQLLSRHHAVVRSELKRYGGREVDTAGDGFFAAFDQPARAIACAQDLVRGLSKLGIRIRAGIHMGEVEVMGPTYRGIAVHIGARVMSLAGPGEVLVSSTVRDLMAGSSVRFADRGEHQLKGVPAVWHLYAAEQEAPTAEPTQGRAEPEPDEEPRRRSRVPIVLGAVVVVLVGALAAVVLATRGGAPPTTNLVAPGANTLVEIDATTGRVEGAVPVGTTPKAVAFGDGGLWVVNFDDQTFQRVDPAAGTAGPARALESSPTAIAVGGGYVWVESSFGDTVDKIDPSQAHSSVPVTVGTGAAGIAFGDGKLWVTNSHDGRLLEIDPATNDITTFHLPVDSDPSGVAVGFGSVWVAESLNRQVVRINGASGKVEATVPILRGEPDALSVGEGYVWATNSSADSVTRIDPSSNLGTVVSGVGNSPTGIAAGAGSAWVANRDDGTVAQIDPRRARVVRRITLGMSPEGVAVADGRVWVTLHAR